MKKITVHTDGAARGNPGPAAIAYSINRDGEMIEHGEAIGSTTNNQAEYRAMLAACRKLRELDLTDTAVEFFADSELMIRQLKGEYKVKDVNLQPHFAAIQQCLATLEKQNNSVNLTAIRRDLNKRADALANLALDA